MRSSFRSRLHTAIRDLLLALAELQFLRGERLPRRRARANFVAAAIYAFHFLKAVSLRDTALDPRLRLAADLYNRGLTSGLATDDGDYVDLAPRVLPLPFGSLALTADGLLTLSSTASAASRNTPIKPNLSIPGIADYGCAHRERFQSATFSRFTRSSWLSLSWQTYRPAAAYTMMRAFVAGEKLPPGLPKP